MLRAEELDGSVESEELEKMLRAEELEVSFKREELEDGSADDETVQATEELDRISAAEERPCEEDKAADETGRAISPDALDAHSAEEEISTIPAEEMSAAEDSGKISGLEELSEQAAIHTAPKRMGNHFFIH